jgi:hypothetical protein
VVAGGGAVVEGGGSIVVAGGAVVVVKRCVVDGADGREVLAVGVDPVLVVDVYPDAPLYWY